MRIISGRQSLEVRAKWAWPVAAAVVVGLVEGSCYFSNDDPTGCDPDLIGAVACIITPLVCRQGTGLGGGGGGDGGDGGAGGGGGGSGWPSIGMMISQSTVTSQNV